MGFEVWFNGIHYEYSKLKTVSVIVDKADTDAGNMVEHTRIDIITRSPPQSETTKESLLQLIRQYVQAGIDGSYDARQGRARAAREKEDELFEQMRKIWEER